MMNYLLPWRNRQVAVCLALLSVFPASEVFAEPVTPPRAAVTISVSPSPTELKTRAPYPDSPGTVLAQAAQQNAAQNAGPAQQTPSQQATPAQQAPAAAPQQTPVPKPEGTAAAPDEQPAGVAASKPSGAAIAPAKQKRIRSYAVRTALILGAAVAIGVVVGASMASPSHSQ